MIILLIVKYTKHSFVFDPVGVPRGFLRIQLYSKNKKIMSHCTREYLRCHLQNVISTENTLDIEPSDPSKPSTPKAFQLCAHSPDRHIEAHWRKFPISLQVDKDLCPQTVRERDLQGESCPKPAGNLQPREKLSAYFQDFQQTVAFNLQQQFKGILQVSHHHATYPNINILEKEDGD